MSSRKALMRLHALLDALRQAAPFLPGDDARHDVERDQPLVRFVLAIDGEGDAGLAEDALGVARLFRQPGGILFGEPFMIGCISRARRAAPSFSISSKQGGLDTII